jgi:hypothetical protein
MVTARNGFTFNFCHFSCLHGTFIFFSNGVRRALDDVSPIAKIQERPNHANHHLSFSTISDHWDAILEKSQSTNSIPTVTGIMWLHSGLRFSSAAHYSFFFFEPMQSQFHFQAFRFSPHAHLNDSP